MYSTMIPVYQKGIVLSVIKTVTWKEISGIQINVPNVAAMMEL
jgi:hypothetical protein